MEVLRQPTKERILVGFVPQSNGTWSLASTEWFLEPQSPTWHSSAAPLATAAGMIIARFSPAN
jgi:hypothetical protein